MKPHLIDGQNWWRSCWKKPNDVNQLRLLGDDGREPAIRTVVYCRIFSFSNLNQNCSKSRYNRRI